MNDKLSNTLSIIHQNKCEIIDLSSIGNLYVKNRF